MSKPNLPILLANGLAFVHARVPAKDVPGEASGRHTTRRGGVLLTEFDGTPIALACGNDDSGQPWRGRGFMVTVSAGGDGRHRFMFSTTKDTERRLGIDGLSHSESTAYARSLLDQARPATRWAVPR